MFFDNDVFDIVYKEANKFKYDIVGFKTIQSGNYTVKINEMKDLYIIIVLLFVSQNWVYLEF